VFTAIHPAAYMINPIVNSVWEEISGEMSMYMESINIYSFCLTPFSLDDQVLPVPWATNLWTHVTSPSPVKEVN